ncbi:hypothetical protein [Flavobacterium sp. RS13.1]|uniref:hypothetical protein n=1 Tax=Flavobacterium sp. RS13.1 TaxID=3400345 RepID=UPI003AB0A6D5
MEIKEKKILIILSVIFSTLYFQKCTFYKPNNKVTILNHKIIYDSLNYKQEGFRVNLYSTLEFNENTITRNEYNNFLLVVKKDTFALVPEINYLEKKSFNKIIEIKYFSQINFKSKFYNNDSILNIIRTSCEIIDSKGEKIVKNKKYNIKTLITLNLSKNEGNIKF